MPAFRFVAQFVHFAQDCDPFSIGIQFNQCAQCCFHRIGICVVAGVQFLDDSYNANPDSMKAALRTLVELDADGKRIAVLGEMHELGDESERGHREVGETAAALKIDQIIAIGNVAAAMAETAQHAGLEESTVVRSTSEAAELLSKTAAPGDLVLIKGSR